MANINKKAKLAAILRKLGDKSSYDTVVFNEISKQIEDIKSTSNTSKVSPYMGEIDVIKKQQDIILKSISSLNSNLASKEKMIFELANLLSEARAKNENTQKVSEEYKKELEKIRSEFRNIINRGGASHQRISTDGTVASNRYADFNLKAGSGMTIAAVNNNQTREIDITLTSSGGSSATYNVEIPTGGSGGAGYGDGVTLNFNVNYVPLFITVGISDYFENNGYTYSAGVISIDSSILPALGEIIRSHNNSVAVSSTSHLTDDSGNILTDDSGNQLTPS